MSPPWQAASSSNRTENKTPTRSGSWNEGVQTRRSSPLRRRHPPPRPSLERHVAGAGGPVSWLEAASPAFPGSRLSPVAFPWRHRTADDLAGLIQWRGRAGLNRLPYSSTACVYVNSRVNVPAETAERNPPASEKIHKENTMYGPLNSKHLPAAQAALRILRARRSSPMVPRSFSAGSAAWDPTMVRWN